MAKALSKVKRGSSHERLIATLIADQWCVSSPHTRRAPGESQAGLIAGLSFRGRFWKGSVCWPGGWPTGRMRSARESREGRGDAIQKSKNFYVTLALNSLLHEHGLSEFCVEEAEVSPGHTRRFVVRGS